MADRENTRHGYRRQDRIHQAAAGEDHFASAFKVGCGDHTRDAQIFECALTQHRLQQLFHPGQADQRRTIVRPMPIKLCLIELREHRLDVIGAVPRRIQHADDPAKTGAGDTFDPKPFLFQTADDADVGVPPGAPAPECKCNIHTLKFHS